MSGKVAVAYFHALANSAEISVTVQAARTARQNLQIGFGFLSLSL